MMGFYGNYDGSGMMSGGSLSLVHSIFVIVILIDLILLAMWLWKQIQKK
jgi:uncharacterized membrane protein